MSNASKPLHVGFVGRVTPAAVTVDLDADNQGVALDLQPHPGAANVVAKFGDFTIGQDAADSFTVTDKNGVVVFSAVSGQTDANTRMTAIEANAAYTEAVETAADYHAQIEELDFGAAALAAFVGGAGSPTAGELTALYARVNLIKADLLAHMASEGTRVARGEHLAAETTIASTLTAVPAASSVATACTLTIALDAAAIDHGDNSGSHFHDDATLAGYVVSSDLVAGNATADKCRIEINALVAALLVHVDVGVPV